MKHAQPFQRSLTLLAFAAALCGPTWVRAADAPAVDVGKSIPDAGSIKEGLFPEDACKELEANGFKCMGFKPPVRFSLPAVSFKVGSAELPDLVKKQLDSFADVLRTRQNVERKVRVEGHADASGDNAANHMSQSSRR